MKYLLIFILLVPTLVMADLYNKIECRSDLSVVVKGDTKAKIYKKGSFLISKKESQILSVQNKQRKTLLKIYPWYGVDLKPSPLIDVVNKNTTLNSQFRIDFKEKGVGSKLNSISCFFK